MVTLQECISKLADFKQEKGEQFGITRLGVFGSVARQEDTEDSDIDIVVEVSKPTLSLMYQLRQALTTLLGRTVDLVRMRDSLRPVFKSTIQKEAIFV
ncbi:MAG: nucleotidyltransferase family protein [Muribaculaceae bacterium]|nr:nucleotidyltransferase family protein [Muribaculaceae bacterium]